MIVAIIIPCHSNLDELVLTLKSICRLKRPIGLSFSTYVVDGSDEPLLGEDTFKDLNAMMLATGITLVYTHGKDNGPYDAMNKGVAQIRGECSWVWFLNSGDQALSMPRLDSLNTAFDLVIGYWQGLKRIGDLTIPSSSCGLEMNHRTEIGNGLCHQAIIFNYEKYKQRRYRYNIYKYAAELDYYIDSVVSGSYLIDDQFRCVYDNTKGISQGKAFLHYREMLSIYSERRLRVSRRRKVMGLVRSQLKSWLTAN